MQNIAVPLVTSSQRTETLLVSVLLQLIIIIGTARLLNLVFQRLRQPGVVGEIVAGLLLGPSLFGHLCPRLAAWIFGGNACPGHQHPLTTRADSADVPNRYGL